MLTQKSALCMIDSWMNKNNWKERKNNLFLLIKLGFTGLSKGWSLVRQTTKASKRTRSVKLSKALTSIRNRFLISLSNMLLPRKNSIF